MPSSRIMWGQIFAVTGIVLLSVWAATQYIAWRLGYQGELGPPLLSLSGTPIYAPYQFFMWWYAFDAYAPGIFLTGATIATAGSLSAVPVSLTLSSWRTRASRKANTYGSAEWATVPAIQASGLLGPDGVVLGRIDQEYLRHEGAEHVLCFAPTRAGKGVGLVIPTLLTWPGSTIVHDIKGENWGLTSGFRERFGRVLKFDPTASDSAAYNPLLEIRKGEWEVRDVQNIADVLVDPEGSLDRRNHWEKTSHSLLVGAILHVMYAEPDKTLAGVANFLSDPKRSLAATMATMMTTPHLGDAGPHPVVASAARELLNKSENERSGVLSTAMSFLGLYRDPVVATVTSRSDWRIADLVDIASPTNLYLVVPPSDINRTKPLIRLILNQIGRRLTEELRPASRQRLLLMLDEFAALGRLDFFESALAFMAGYGIRSVLIAQSLNQIEKAYGANNSILDNCHVRVTFATNDERTARRISDALGTATEQRDQKNFAGHRLSPWLTHLMVSRSETARPLLTPGEIMQLPPSDAIVMVSGFPPIRAKKVRYFEDQRLQERVVPAAKKSTRLIGRPDDWSGLPAVPAPAEPPMVQPAQANVALAAGKEKRRIPELGQRPAPTQPPLPFEFGPPPEHRQSQIARLHDVQNNPSALARQASMDPNDGIEL